jgi:hypothetical protein
MLLEDKTEASKGKVSKEINQENKCIIKSRIQHLVDQAIIFRTRNLDQVRACKCTLLASTHLKQVAQKAFGPRSTH